MANWRKIVRRWNCKELWILLAALVVILLVAKPPRSLVKAYHELKAPSVERASIAAADAGDWDLAFDTARDGLYWSPQSYPLQRVLVKAMAARDGKIERGLLEVVSAHPSASLDDRLEFLKLALDGGDALTFSRLYNALPEDARERTEVAVQRLRLNLLLQRPVDALKAYRALPEKARAETQTRLYGIAARIRSARSEEEFVEAQSWIAGVIAEAGSDDSDGEITLNAFRMLDEIPAVHRRWQHLPGVKEWLDRHEELSVSDRLIGATIDLVELPESERKAYRAVITEKFQAADTVAVGRWLLRQGQAEEALNLPKLGADLAKNATDTFEVRLQALVLGEHWQQAFDWLKNPPAGAHPVMTELSRAAVAAQLGDHAMKRKNLAAAIEEADILSAADFFFLIARGARQFGEIGLAADAALKGVKAGSSGGLMPPTAWFEGLQLHLWQADRVEDFRVINHALLRRNQNDFVRLNNELYLSLLLDPDPEIEKIVDAAGVLVQAKPVLPALRSTVAWALLHSEAKSGATVGAITEPGAVKPAQRALSVLTDSSIDWSSAGDTDRLILAHAQWANGEQKAARETLKNVDEEALRTVEREKLWKPLVEEMDVGPGQ